MLERLARLCRLGAEHGCPPEARLAPDMFPLVEQAATAAHFPLRGAFPLASRDVPEPEPHDGTLPGMADAVERSAAALATIGPNDLDPTREIAFEAGFAQHRLDGQVFLLRFILPNFHFHIAMTYAILRAQGVPVGKADFDGVHGYPPGFRFT